MTVYESEADALAAAAKDLSLVVEERAGGFVVAQGREVSTSCWCGARTWRVDARCERHAT